MISQLLTDRAEEENLPGKAIPNLVNLSMNKLQELVMAISESLVIFSGCTRRLKRDKKSLIFIKYYKYLYY